MENLVVYLLIAIAILLVVVLSLLGKIVHSLDQIHRLANKWHKGSEAEKDLRDGQFDEVIKRSEKEINRNPTNIQAHSCLARAYYAKEMWEEAKREMEIVAKINPSWKREFTQPYIEEIDKQLSSNNAD